MVPTSMAGMKKLWLNSLHVMSNAKVFAMQDGQLAIQLSIHPAGQTNMPHYIDPYDTRIDKTSQQ